MVLVQTWPIFQLFFFQAIQASKMSVTIFQSEKTPFQAIKTRSSKNRKLDIFFKKVNPWFWSKNGHFSNFSFRQYRLEKCFLRYCRAKNRLSRLQKQEVKKVEKFTCFQRGQPMVLVQKWLFFQKIFLGNIGQENVCQDILERKNAFLVYKYKKFKEWKIDIFIKGLTQAFGLKIAIFETFFFRQYRPGKCLLRYPRAKKRLSRLQQ